MPNTRTFKIPKDYYDEGTPLFKKTNLTFKPGFTVLVGCNGSGKTTILQHLKNSLKKTKTPFIDFDNLHDGGSNSLQNALWMGNIDFMAEGATSSEGENIVMNIGLLAGKIGAKVKQCIDNNKKELWILIDAIDSGLSVDNIIDVKNLLIKTVLDDCKNNNITVFFIASVNEYELAKGEMQFDVTECEYVNLKTYDEYADFIIKSGDKKKKRYENS